MERCDVAIVGGGPVGLLLGCLLVQRGLDVRVLERDLLPRSHSRAIGIHPPGLACLDQVGAATPLVARGIRVRRASAFGRRRLLGAISFDSLPGAYPFVLCVPQTETERVLAARLAALAPDVLRRGATVVDLSPERSHVALQVRMPEGERVLRARFVVGCDGKHSAIRRASRIAFPGGAYRTPYFAMADLADRTPFGDEAAVFVSPEGLVESFPMPGGQRRWVVALDGRPPAATATLVAQLVAARTGHEAPAESATMVSSFCAERYLAERFVRGAVALAGDAAHVLSPIGGQGMNLGWLDAQRLAEQLSLALSMRTHAEAVLADYARSRRRAARSATRRAELFMSIGRGLHAPRLCEATLRALLSPALSSHAAQLFTMRGLGAAPIAARTARAQRSASA